MKHKSHTTLADGFTLLEVVVSSGILVLVLGAMVHLGRVSIRSHDVSLERSRAYGLLQGQAEILHAMRDSLYQDQRPNQSWETAVWPPTGQIVSPCWLAEEQRWSLVQSDAIHCPTILNGVNTQQIDGLTFRSLVTILPAASAAFLPLKDAKETLIPFESMARRFRLEVAWESQGDVFSITSETLLTDWQPGY